MRKLCLSDSFRFARLMKVTRSKDAIAGILNNIKAAKKERKTILDGLRAGLLEADETEKPMIQKALEEAQKDDDWFISVGIDAFLIILECAAETGAEEAVYKFLAPVWEKKPEEVAAMSIEACIEAVKQMMAENDFVRFFDSARRMGNL